MLPLSAAGPPLDPDRILALSYVPAARRVAIDALWRLDAALGAAVAGGRDPMISRIKLVWWRDELEKLDIARAPSEPVLQAVAEHVLPAGVTGTELAALEEGWTILLTPGALQPEDLAAYAAGRGGRLFRYAARILGGHEEAAIIAGEAWALADLARHSNDIDAESALAAVRHRTWHRVPGRLRPLGMLGAVARRDAEPGRTRWEPQGSPGRMLRMLRHRLTGY